MNFMIANQKLRPIENEQSNRWARRQKRKDELGTALILFASTIPHATATILIEEIPETTDRRWSDLINHIFFSNLNRVDPVDQIREENFSGLKT
jgi:hypothetical protein